MSTNPFAIKQIIDERNDALDMVRKVETLNAELEEKMAALRQDAERYREYRKGKALVIKCGNLTIFTGSNPDYERKYPDALDAALDAAIAHPAARAAEP